MLKFKRKWLGLKAEAGGYGVDSVPVAATDSLLVRNLRVFGLRLNKERRDVVKTYYANEGDIITGQYGGIEFDVEIAGAGTSAITVPKYGTALRACAHSQTVGAGDVAYAPISAAEESFSAYYQIDGRQHKLLGSRGSKFGFTIRAGALPLYHFGLMGLHAQPTDTALTPGTFTGFQKPLAVNNANTTPFTLHGFAGKFREFTFDMGLQAVYRNLPNSESVVIIGRNPTGKITLESELVATKDWWTLIKAETLGALACTQGTVAFNKAKFDAANVQITELDDSGEEEGVSMLKMGLDFQSSAAGNDEYSIKTL